MGERATYDTRRREWQKRLPEHYCPRCTNVTYPEDDHCLDCGKSTPEGWPSIQDGYDAWLGRVLDGRYLVTKRVGVGATGSVYRVESLAISREFAVKIMNFRQTQEGLEPDQIRARLHREIEALSRLRNPHVVPFYEVIDLYDDFVGIVMDFISGDTLEDLVNREGPLKLRRACGLMRQISNGLHEAHAAGMIHRDLKPENLMVEIMPAGDDFVHILDFGIVRVEDGVSMTKGFLGTPLYASPEQAMAGSLDSRSDIYSLGAIFFFCVTGRPPFTSENVYEILRAHVRTLPPSLAEAAPDRLFPRELEELVSQMLSKSPANRPQDLSEVIKELDRLLHSPKLDRADLQGLESVELPNLAAESESEVSPSTGPHLTIDEESEPSFRSSERDHTGPKAAIFRRGPSRNSVRVLVDASRQTLSRDPDRILLSDTGAIPFGVVFEEKLQKCIALPEQRIIAVDARQTVFDIRQGTTVTEMRARGQVLSIAPAGQGVLTGQEDGRVVRYEGNQREELFQDVRRAPINAVASSAKEEVYVAGSESGRVYLNRTPQNRGAWARIQDGPPVTALAVNRKGSIFAVARRHREVEVSNVINPRTAFSRFSTPSQVRDLAISSDDHLVAVLYEDNSVELFMSMTAHSVIRIRDDKHDLLGVGFDQEGRLVGLFMLENSLFLLDLQREMEHA